MAVHYLVFKSDPQLLDIKLFLTFSGGGVVLFEHLWLFP